MTAPASVAAFGDRAIKRIRRLGNPLCVGLDPHLSRIPDVFRAGSMQPEDPQTAGVVRTFLFEVVERLSGRVAVVKPQSAFFEQLGWPGIRVLEDVVRHARDQDLLVIVDAKRNDIGSTAEAYARAYIGADAPIPGDALTVNPYIGTDSLAPFFEAAGETGSGLFVLTRTSNPGSGSYQQLMVAPEPLSPMRDQLLHEPLFEAVARTLVAPVDRLRGPETGWSSCGIVVGATWPGDADRLRAILPHALFLVPGFGAQGGGAAAAVRGFVSGPSGLEGGIVNSSRAILYPARAADTGAKAWQSIFDQTLDQAIDTLVSALH